jgi:hypothetical protein
MKLDEISVDLGHSISESAANITRQSLLRFLLPLLSGLDDLIDKRLVRTFYKTIEAIIQFRQSSLGLLLSELGGHILSPSQAPAGTKRLSNLLRCQKWAFREIEPFLWKTADEKVTALDSADEAALAIWDESVVEKQESEKLEGLCPVRSSKAARRLRIKPGYYHPPTKRPIFVPGMNWIGLLITGSSCAPTLAAMRWWTNRGDLKSDRRTEEKRLMRKCQRTWGNKLLHVFDRGFAGWPWLNVVFEKMARFVLRWPKGYKLVDSKGQCRKAWEISRGKRSLDYKTIYDSRRRCQRKVGIYYTPVTHPEKPSRRLTLVVARRKGQAPWYLLTNEPIANIDEAGSIVFAYARRWQIEMS